jgi:hypothetical protein
MKYLIFCLLLILSQTIQGQLIDHYKYHAVYIPSNYLKSIAIDGHIEDWDWVPNYYKLQNSHFINYEQVDSKDLDVECFVAWSDITNKMYIIAKVADDSIISNRVPQDDAIRMNDFDGITIIVNTNLESGAFWSGGGYKLLFHNILAFPLAPTSHPDNSNIFYGTHWLQNKNYLNFATSISKNKNGRFTTLYEVELELWENLSLFSKKLSKVKLLKSDLSVGLTIAFNDIDKNNDDNAFKIRTYSGNGFEYRAEESSCFILDSPKMSSNLREDLLLLNK